eukprot:3980033-Pyramimonas_sp.AAC.1
MEALRTGKGRWAFLETVAEEMRSIQPIYQRDWASPDTIFGALEQCIVSAGKKHFLGRAPVREGYREDCERRRELLRRRVSLRGSKCEATESEAHEIDLELRSLSHQLQLDRRRALRRHRDRLMAEASECWERRRTAEAMRASRRAARCRYGPKKRDARLA